MVIETIKEISQPDESVNQGEEERGNARSTWLRNGGDKEIHDEGIYILITPREHLISNTLVRKHLVNVLT